MRRSLKTWLVVSLFLLVVAVTANAKTIYVDADRPPGGGGTNWTDAYKYLQDALADANTSAKPVEIRVAQGTYKPDEGAGVEDANRTETFQLINGVTLKGGYAGLGEADPNARDITNYETILSGDLDGNDVPVATSDLLTEPTRAENSYHVVTGTGTDANAVLDGFTITAGNANGTVSPNKFCGGLDGESQTVLNCTFTDNSAITYGAMWGGGDPAGQKMEISDCNFTGNWGYTASGLAGGEMVLTNCEFNNNSGGSALYNAGYSSLTNCVFNSNTSSSWGGGIRTFWESTITLSDCIFINNTAERGGGIYDDGTITLSNCTFIGNTANSGEGGGMYINTGNFVLTNCIFSGNHASTFGGAMSTLLLTSQTSKLTNCTFSGNSASSDGGAYYTAHDYTTFTNCTFSENEAGRDGGAFCIWGNGGTADFNNCILWGNTANNEGPQIAIKTAHATVDVNYSDVEGGESDIYVSAGTLHYDVSNINEDPLFVDADGADDIVGTEDDNLRLLADSNCIDAGDNTAVPADTTDLDGDGNTAEAIPLDLNRFARFIDDLCTTDTGNGTAPVVDMGAYEFLRSDIDSDGDVNFKDFAQFALYWLHVACGTCSGADLTCDGNVDWNDVRELADNWLW